MKYDEFYNINDVYKIKRDLNEIKKILLAIDEDIEKFLSPKKVKKRGRMARRKLRDIRRIIIPQVARNILKTIEDYESDYS